MLKFLVLGQIPGTDIQVNFIQLVLIGILIVLFFEMFAVHRRHVLVTTEANKTIATSKKSSRKSTRARKTSVKNKAARTKATKKSTKKST